MAGPFPVSNPKKPGFGRAFLSLAQVLANPGSSSPAHKSFS